LQKLGHNSLIIHTLKKPLKVLEIALKSRNLSDYFFSLISTNLTMIC
jgi:hypothetical protein